MANTKCAACGYDFKRNEKTTGCFICKEEYHIKCSGMHGFTEEKIKAILEINRIKYVCLHCERSNMMQQIGDFKSTLEGCINTIAEQNNTINKINKMLEYLTNAEGIHKNKSYSDAVKKNNDVIVIKPNNQNQKSKTTQEEIKTKIDPSKLAVGVEGIKNISKGGIVISCNNNNSKEKLKNSVQKELGNKYQVIEPKLQNPEIIITGTEKDTINEENEDILEKIIMQNELGKITENIENKINIKRKFISKDKRDYGNIILEIDTDIYEKIITKGKLNIGWRKCNVFDYYNIIRCFKCNGFGHFSRECKNEESCGKCAGPHKTKDCDSEEMKCINCLKSTEKLNIPLNYNHTAFDRECICYKRVMERVKSKIKHE